MTGAAGMATGAGTDSPAFAPSGEQIEIRAGDQQLVVVEVGGGIRSYAVAGQELLDGYRVDEMCASGRGQVLIPWPNRIRDGAYTFDGRRHQVPLNEPEQGNAIHGLVRWASWTVREREPHRVVMEHTMRPQPGFPFALDMRIEYLLSAAGLDVETTATNIGPSRCPFGAGAHPWFLAGAPIDDTLVLTVPAAAVLRSDERGIPIEATPVDGTELDFRDPRQVGPSRLDHAFTDLSRDADGLARVQLRRPDGIAITVWLDRSYPFVMLTTGDVLPDVDRRSLAIEPMTCPPNAFQTGEALVQLAPGEAFTGRWGFRAALPADDPPRGSA
jgi:aldose 1-epimerase